MVNDPDEEKPLEREAYENAMRKYSALLQKPKKPAPEKSLCTSLTEEIAKAFGVFWLLVLGGVVLFVLYVVVMILFFGAPMVFH